MGLSILVTGAAGSVGRRVCKILLERGHSVRAFDIPAADFADLASQEAVEVVRGDIRDGPLVTAAASGCDWVLHLAAILPPASEANRERTLSVNVDGTRVLLDSLAQGQKRPPLVFASTVATYGDTSTASAPLAADYPQHPLDTYGESKMRAEGLLLARDYPVAILRIGGVAVAEFLEPPDPWPFTADQRMEFVLREDLALALANAVDNSAVVGHTLNIAGGRAWQLHGAEYVAGIYRAFGVPAEEASFSARPGPYDWYDTALSQALLDYQHTSYGEFVARLADIAAAL